MEEMELPSSLLDYGCGIGDFLFMCGSINLDYTGVDVNPRFIQRFKQRLTHLGVEARAQVADLLADPEAIVDHADYVIASGVFCFLPHVYAKKLLQRLWELTERKLIVNFLKEGEVNNPRLRAYTMQEIFELQSGISPFFKIRADYRSNDVTLILHRQ